MTPEHKLMVEKFRDAIVTWRDAGFDRVEYDTGEADDLADLITALSEENERLREAVRICDRVLHFDLRHMIEWGDDYNQAVKDAADITRAALGEKQ